MAGERHLATVRDYHQLIQALRQRSDELKVSRETLDAISGLQQGYSAKLLCSPPIRGLGKQSLGPFLGAMGCALILVEDTEQLERIQKRLVRRKWWPKNKNACHTQLVMPTTRRRKKMDISSWS